MNDKVKNLTVRTLSGAFLVVLLLGATLLSVWGYVALLAVIAIVGLWEFYNLCDACGYKPQRICGTAMLLALLAVTVSILAGYETEWNGRLITAFAVIFILLMLPTVFVSELFRDREHPIANVATTIMGPVYVGLPIMAMTFMPYMLSNGEWNPWAAICYVLIIWANDSWAYLAGITFGRHRMCERISPKKSWEGFVGGVVAAVAFALLFGHLLGGQLLLWGVVGFVVAVTGVAGDFVESLFKRSANVKDSGAILPGHGGMLDRFDALFISAPYAFVVVVLIVKLLTV